MNKQIIDNMNKHNKNISKYGCRDEKAIRLKEINNDIRPPFFRDIDKIIYTLSYTRYIDKTQVYTYTKNDMISKRMTHVQMVSKIARTIGRALNLNEDLIEAASLGHDLGHVPFGHEGEKILNKISLENNEGNFYHNVQSVRTLMEIENNGKGSNITLQVLDAILCHNGEILQGKYSPCEKDCEQFMEEYKNSYTDPTILKKTRPMTLEGCVVRISDIIAYVGKDIEDGIRLKKISKESLPKNIVNLLGPTNPEIVNTIINDVINNSINKNYIQMSEPIFTALNELIKFNYSCIYNKANSKKRLKKYEIMFRTLFVLYVNQIKNKEIYEDIYTTFLNEMSEDYIKNNTAARIAIDYIAGMTDDFFKKQYNKTIKKKKIKS